MEKRDHINFDVGLAWVLFGRSVDVWQLAPVISPHFYLITLTSILFLSRRLVCVVLTWMNLPVNTCFNCRKYDNEHIKYIAYYCMQRYLNKVTS